MHNIKQQELITTEEIVTPEQANPPKMVRRKRKSLPVITTPPLWNRSELPPSSKPSISELQEFVQNYQYKPLPTPLSTIISTQDAHPARLDRYGNYEILRTGSETNSWSALTRQEKVVVSLSGGLGSALAGERAIKLHGRERVLFWFSDVLVENPDLYRFLHDLMNRWGGRLIWYTDGRKPKEVWSQKKIIPNNLLAPCTYILKVKPFRNFIKAMPVLPSVYLGYKPHETDRHVRTLASYAKAIPEAQIAYPLLWEPQENRDLMQVCAYELGIDPPLLYKLGFDYNNCGGGCCRGGIKCWVRTALFFPEVFADRSEWEQDARSQGGSRANRSFAARSQGGKKQPLTLQQILTEEVPHAAHLLHMEP